MKKWIRKLLVAGLVLCTVMGSIVSCADNEDPTNGTSAESSTDTSIGESETVDELASELDALGTVDWGNKNFGILYADDLAEEITRDNSTGTEVMNSAVFERNTLFEERYKLKLNMIGKSGDALNSAIMQEAQTASGDFIFIENRMGNSTGPAVQGLLYDYNDLDVDLEKDWWDQGIAQFSVNGHIYFMTGHLNFIDDNLTYALIFNKEMREEYRLDNPYESVKNGTWTLDYFNGLIQNLARDNGNGQWGPEDNYGFATTHEYGLTFFIGSDLRFVDSSADQALPTLYMKEGLEKAVEVVDMTRRIYHGGSTYTSPAGEEGNGLTMFKEGRTLFYGEVVEYLKTITESSDSEFGVLPVPKYDEEQQNYCTWTHSLGSCMSVSAGVRPEQAQDVGKLVQAWGILSSQKVQPIYYNVLLTARNIHDAESAEIIDTIFENRIYDMSLYYSGIGNFSLTVKDAVNNNTDTFMSSYQSLAKGFDRKVERYFGNLG